MTTSATGGYLAPAAFSTNDDALQDIIQAFIVGVTALTGTRVRPAWQPDMPVIPTNDTNWCAYSLGNFEAGQAYQVQVADGDDTVMQFQQHESFDLSCSFYGANCQRYAAVLRDGLQVAQNREALWLQGISLSGGVQIVHAPELINDVWHDRYDINVQMARAVFSEYPVLHFLGVAGTVTTDSPEIVTDWSTGSRYYTSPVQAIFDAMIPEPDAITKEAVNTAVVSLVNAGYWPRFDRFGVMQDAAVQQNGLLDWKNPAKTLSLNGAASWVRADGVVGAGSSNAYVGTDYTPLTDAVNYTQTSSSFFIYTKFRASYPSLGRLMWTGTIDGTETALFESIGGAYELYVDGLHKYTAGSTVGDGFICVNRPAADTVELYKNGVNIPLSGGGVCSTLTNRPLRLIEQNTDEKACAWGIGGSFTDAEQLAIKAIIDTYLAAIP